MDSRSDFKMMEKYEELAAKSIEFSKSFVNKQLWIGIGGGPGAGKSTLADRVASLINTSVGENIAIVIGMDGFHFSRSQLRDLSDESRTFDDLLCRRGSPWTFDVNVRNN